MKNFEDKLNRLEEIVRALEGGEATLDESLKLYAEGVKLVEVCNKKLDDTEKKIKLMVVSGDAVKETDFE